MGYEADAVRDVNSHYGPRDVNEKYGGVYTTKDEVKKAVWTFDYDDLPVGGSTNFEQVIPANATIVSANFEVITAFTSTSTTSDLVVGCEQSDGTDIDLDGFLAATELTQATIAVVGARYVGAGALVGLTIGTAAGELYVAPTVDDLLTGKARVTVEYIK